MMQKEIHRQEANRESMDKQVKQALEALTAAGEGVWDEVKSGGAEAAISLVEGMRKSHVDMIMALSQQVSSPVYP